LPSIATHRSLGDQGRRRSERHRRERHWVDRADPVLQKPVIRWWRNSRWRRAESWPPSVVPEPLCRPC